MAKEDRHNFFENVRFFEPPKEEKSETIFVCREVSQDTGKIKIYPVGWTGDSSYVFGNRESVSGMHRRDPNKRCFAIRESNYFENMDKIEELLCREEIPDEKTLSDYRIEDLG